MLRRCVALQRHAIVATATAAMCARWCCRGVPATATTAALQSARRRCSTSAHTPATTRTTAAAAATTATDGDNVAPQLSFLARPEILVETVAPTLAMCDKLLGQIPHAATPQERHDLIDSTSNVLCLLLDPCEFVRQIHPDARYRASADAAFQQGFEYMATVNTRRDLYDVVVQLDSPDSRAQLDAEAIKNVVQLRRDMESNGIHLDDRARAKVAELNVENETLAMRMLADRQGANPYVTLRHLLRCRHELAQLLGYPSYAHKQLQGKMLDTPEKVWHFLCGIAHKYRPAAERELGLIRQHVGEVRNRGNTTDEARATVAATLVRDAMPAQVHEYFSVANCIRGIQCLCSETFGVCLEQVPFAPDEVFSAAAKKFYVYDKGDDNNKNSSSSSSNGSSTAAAGSGGGGKRFLGVILLDMYMNETKHCTSGHLTLQLGCTPHHGVLAKVGLQLPPRQYPVVALTCNVGAASAASSSSSSAARAAAGATTQYRADGTPDDELTLMDWSEVVTLFHEFGHAMHTIFGQTRVQNLAGTRGSVDFVETFSQLFEQFLTSHEFLRLWAHRLGTREPISRDLVERRNAAASMFHHLDTFDQILLSAEDQVLHGPQPLTVYFPHGDDGRLGKRTLGDLADYGRGTFTLAKALVDMARPLAVVEPTEVGMLRSLSLEHMCSYPADYYGYLYSLRIAQRIWRKKFAANPLSRDAGRELVEQVMRHGAACDPRTTIASYLQDDLDDTELWA